MILESMTTCGKKTLNILPAITKALSSAEQDLHNLAHNVTSPFTVAQLFVGMYRMYMVARACHALHYGFGFCFAVYLLSCELEEFRGVSFIHSV